MPEDVDADDVELDESDDELDELDDASLDLLSDEEDDSELLPPLLLVELYKSEYQPPPLRMKPVPREIWRRAVS